MFQTILFKKYINNYQNKIHTAPNSTNGVNIANNTTDSNQTEVANILASL